MLRIPAPLLRAALFLAGLSLWAFEPTATDPVTGVAIYTIADTEVCWAHDVKPKKAILSQLDKSLNKIYQRVPEHARPFLKSIPIVFHPKTKNQPVHAGAIYSGKGMVLAGGVRVKCGFREGGAYIQVMDLDAFKTNPAHLLLHEMSHAVELDSTAPNRKNIATAYANAIERKIYGAATSLDPNSPVLDNYVVSNANEYFAELSTAYFIEINYGPKNNAHLRKVDPTGWEMVRSVWQEAWLQEGGGAMEYAPE